MINARVPLFVIRVIGNFYSKLSGLVYWKGVFFIMNLKYVVERDKKGDTFYGFI